MARNIDVAFKFGCGRYIQEENAIENNLYRELKHLGTKVLFVARENGRQAAEGSIRKALDGTDVSYEFYRFDSVPCMENAEEIAEYVKENGFEIVCGVGGGVMGDIVKLVAEITNISLVHIPTSSATCVPATPLSIMYDRETRAFRGGYICRREADAVIIDTKILVQQPPRLFWAGIIDSKAKLIEIQHYFSNGKEIPIGLEMALSVSEKVYQFYEQNMEDMAEAINSKTVTKTFEQALFYAIAVTGIISGLSKNSSQTALAHALYYNARTDFCAEAREYLHGEIVGVGLVVQLAYNGLDHTFMTELLHSMHLPATLSDIGIAPNEENRQKIINWLYGGVKSEGEEKAIKQKLSDALTVICG